MNNVGINIAIIAAGTGGHIYPGLAIANVLLNKKINVSWIGIPSGIENQIITDDRIKMFHLDFMGLRGKNLSTWIFLPIRLVKAIFDSFKIIKKINPHLVLGMGGYLSFPIAIAAKIKKIKIVIHEANYLVGTANKFLIPFANLCLSGFKNTITNSVHTGNPVKPEFFQLDPPNLRLKKRKANAENKSKSKTTIKKLNISVIGGSLGAKFFNQIIPQAFSEYCQRNPKVLISLVHQCGKLHLSDSRKNYQNCQIPNNLNWQLVEYLENVPEIMGNSDLIICRAGAQTVSEIAAAGVAALFVPFPFAINDHQTFNAQYLANENAAFLIQQKDLTIEKIITIISEHTPEKFANIGEQARKLSMPDADKKCAELCIDLISATS